MYWIFFVLFAAGVLVPDIIRGGASFLSEERAEEMVLFLLGATGFVIFLFKERELLSEKREKEKNKKRLDETGKDLIESYSYIGEVNRKTDLLIEVMLGLSEGEILDKNKEKEAYLSIADAAKLMLKGENATLLFFNDQNDGIIEGSFNTNNPKFRLEIKTLKNMGGVVNIKKDKDCIIISSPNKIGGFRSYLKIEGYSKEEEKRPKNAEILKMLASQALLVYSFSNAFRKRAEAGKD
jgi:hypothetical protein